MIRQPTSPEEEYRWYKSAMRGLRPATHEGEPQSGWFKMRETKGGPWIPVRIWLEKEVEGGELTNPEKPRCRVGTFANEREVDQYQIWVRCAGHPISPEEFNRLYWDSEAEMRAMWKLEERPARP